MCGMKIVAATKVIEIQISDTIQFSTKEILKSSNMKSLTSLDIKPIAVADHYRYWYQALCCCWQFLNLKSGLTELLTILDTYFWYIGASSYHCILVIFFKPSVIIQQDSHRHCSYLDTKSVWIISTNHDFSMYMYHRSTRTSKCTLYYCIVLLCILCWNLISFLCYQCSAG